MSQRLVNIIVLFWIFRSKNRKPMIRARPNRNLRRVKMLRKKNLQKVRQELLLLVRTKINVRRKFLTPSLVTFLTWVRRRNWVRSLQSCPKRRLESSPRSARQTSTVSTRSRCPTLRQCIPITPCSAGGATSTIVSFIGFSPIILDQQQRGEDQVNNLSRNK